MDNTLPVESASRIDRNEDSVLSIATLYITQAELHVGVEYFGNDLNDGLRRGQIPCGSLSHEQGSVLFYSISRGAG